MVDHASIIRKTLLTRLKIAKIASQDLSLLFIVNGDRCDLKIAQETYFLHRESQNYVSCLCKSSRNKSTVFPFHRLIYNFYKLLCAEDLSIILLETH